MRFPRILWLIVAAILMAAPVQADDLTAAKHHAILHLMDLTGASKMQLSLGSFLSQQLFAVIDDRQNQVPVEVYEIIVEQSKRLVDERLPELLEEIVPIYHRHFTHDEIRQLIAFYRTDVGQKTLRALPRIIEESGTLGQQWGEILGMELIQRVDLELSAQGLHLDPPQ